MGKLYLKTYNSNEKQTCSAKMKYKSYDSAMDLKKSKQKQGKSYKKSNAYSTQSLFYMQLKPLCINP